MLKRGIIYDGCPIVTKGTIRVTNGDIAIDTNHNQMLVDGKNFSDLCGSSTSSRTEQGELKDEFEDTEKLKAKIAELTLGHEQLVNGLRQTVDSLQVKLQQEHSVRSSFEGDLERERKISEEATKVITGMKGKLQETVELVEALKLQLDTAKALLEEKENRVGALQFQLVEKDAQIKLVAQREQEAQQLVGTLRNQIAVMEQERSPDKQTNAVILDDFSEWRHTSDEEIDILKQQLSLDKEQLARDKAQITTLKNELEISELEDTEYQKTIASLQNDNEVLKQELQRSLDQEANANANALVRSNSNTLVKSKSLNSLRNILKINKTPKEKSEKEKANKEKPLKQRKSKGSLSSTSSALPSQ